MKATAELPKKPNLITVPNHIGCYLFQKGLLDVSCARSRCYPCQRRKSGKGAHVRRFVIPLDFV